MNRKLLELVPKRYLCPFCGKWHEWTEHSPLQYYDSDRRKYVIDEFINIFDCDNKVDRIFVDKIFKKYVIYVDRGYLCYYVGPFCEHYWDFTSSFINEKISIESIKEHSDQPIVTFDIDFSIEFMRHLFGTTTCEHCECREDGCNIIKCDSENHSSVKITLGFEFEQSEYIKFSNVGQQLECKERNEDQENEVAPKNEGNLQQLQAEQSAQPKLKEEKTMANNIFNMNIECGPNTDENITSTLMGVAVRNGDSWRIYDKNKGEIIDVGDIQLGNFPIFILPSTELEKGDLIKYDGEYYFVTIPGSDDSYMETVSARTGDVKNIVPIKNILGLSCYSKVIAISDSLDIADGFDIDKLPIMAALSSNMGENGGQMNQLLPLLLFKDKLGGNDDMMKLVLMSTMMGGNTAEPNSSLAGLLMADTLLSKKRD